MADVSNPLSASKSYWSRPDGKVGTLFPLVGIAAVLWFFGSALGDFVVNAVDNIFHLLIVGTGILALLWILFDSNARAAVFYLYRSIVRFFVGMLIDLDPIGVLKTYKERMVGKLKEMQEALGGLKGQKNATLRLQEKKKGDYENSMRLLNRAQQTNDMSKIALEGKQVARLEKQLKKYEGDLNQMGLLINVLNRYYGLCEDTITDMDREIQSRIEDREYAKNSRGAVRGAMAILKGLPEKEMWDDSLAALEKQYNEAIGEVENFLDVTKNILTQADLQDGADADKAMALLDEWQKKNANVALGGQGSQVSKATIIQDAARQLTAAPASINLKGNKPVYDAVPRQQSAGSDDYSDLLR